MMHEIQEDKMNGVSNLECNFTPTLFDDVNEVLYYFLSNIKRITGYHLVGMYVIGSLAIGDFNHESSDIDFVVITDLNIDNDTYIKLRNVHADFLNSDSCWSRKIDAVYVTIDALKNNDSSVAMYPQAEHGTELFKAILEKGWVFQVLSLRKFGITIYGPEPVSFVSPSKISDMIPAVKAISEMWLNGAENDPSWLEWLENRRCQVFVVQTLCRMLYSLRTGSIASKPAAAQWAVNELGQTWNLFINESLSKQYSNDKLSLIETERTVKFIKFIFDEADNMYKQGGRCDEVRV